MPGPRDEEKSPAHTPLGSDQETTPLDAGERQPPTADRGPSEPILSSLSARYEILAELGRGGMGIVYKARDLETSEVVALKVLRPEIAARTDVIERFKAELRLARKITHKNVCRTYELLRFGDAVVITMEFVEGESLRAFLSRYGSVPLRRGLEWSVQICDALGEAHAQGIVHRDMKPENILIGRNGQAKVMDFGIARSIQADATMTGTLVGTPAYMSPEQAEGKPPDPRSDIYALGLVLYEMFAGQPAFSADTPVAYMLMQVKEQPPPPHTVEPYLPGLLDRAIQKCLEKTPAKRFQTVAELQAALTKKPTLEPDGTQLQLPPHLGNSRPSDLGLLALGVLGLTTFLLLAPMVIPEMGIRVRFTREMFIEKAQAEMVRRGWTPTRSPWLHVQFTDQAFKFISDRIGYSTARSRLSQEICPYLYDVDYSPPEIVPPFAESSKKDGLITYDPTGMIRTVQMPIIDWVPAGEGPPQEKALEVAKQEIQKTFGVDPNQLAAENQAPLAVEGRHGYSFLWSQNDPTGIEWHYQADIFARPTLVKRWSTVPEDYRSGPVSFLRLLPLIVLVAWSVLAFALFLIRRIFSKIHAKEAAVLSAVAALAGIGLGLGVPIQLLVIKLIATAVYFGTFIAWFIAVSSVFVFLAERRWPHLAESYSATIQLKPAPRAAGLAVTRGATCGLLVLGLYAALLRFGLFADLLSRPSLEDYTLEINSGLSGVTVLGFTLLGAAGVAYFLGLLLPLVRRRTSAAAALVIAGGLLSILTTDLSPPSVAFHCLLKFTTGAAFAWILVSFDFLTLLAAVFTFTLWQRGYALIPMFETVGNWQDWFPFLLWAAILAWGLFAAFRPSWERLGRRLAETFD